MHKRACIGLVFSFLVCGGAWAQSSSVTITCSGSDITAALNSAVAVADRRVTLTPGICRYSGGGVIADHTVVSGSGPMTTRIEPLATISSPTNGYYLQANGYGSGIESLGFVVGPSDTIQTSGSFVDLSGTQSYIRNFYMDGDYNGILLRGSVSRVLEGRMQNSAPNATRIKATGGDNSQVIDNVLIGPSDQILQPVRYGIEVVNSQALTISNTSVLAQNINLYVHSDSANDQVAGLYVHDSYFDNAKQENIKITSISSGAVSKK